MQNTEDTLRTGGPAGAWGSYTPQSRHGHQLVNTGCSLARFYLPVSASSEHPKTRGQAGGSAWLSLKFPNKSYLLPPLPPRDIDGRGWVLSPAVIESCGGRSLGWHQQQQEGSF